MPYNETPSTKGCNMNEKFVALKNHVKLNRAKYAAAAVLTTWIAVQAFIVAPSWNEFLEEHDLREEYYAQED